MTTLKEIEEYNFGITDSVFIRKNIFKACFHIKTAIDLYCYSHHGGVCNMIDENHPLILAFNHLKELEEKICSDQNIKFERFPEFFELHLPNMEDVKKVQGESGVYGKEINFLNKNLSFIDGLDYDHYMNNDLCSDLKNRVKKFEILHQKYVISLIQKISSDNNDDVMSGDLSTLKNLILKYKHVYDKIDISEDADSKLLVHIKERIWQIRMIHTQTKCIAKKLDKKLYVHFFRIENPKIAMNLYLLSCLMRDIVDSNFENKKIHDNYCLIDGMYYFIENNGHKIKPEQVNNAINSNINVIEKFFSEDKMLDYSLYTYYEKLFKEYRHYQNIY